MIYNVWPLNIAVFTIVVVVLNAFLKYFKGCRVHKKYKSPVFENQKEK